MSVSDSDRRSRPSLLGSHARAARLSLKLARKTVEDTEALVEESRKLLDRPVYPFSPERCDPRK
jgi:hypothetical protein